MKRKITQLKLVIHLLEWYFIIETVGKDTPNVRVWRFLCFSLSYVWTNEHIVGKKTKLKMGMKAKLFSTTQRAGDETNVSWYNQCSNERHVMTYDGPNTAGNDCWHFMVNGHRKNIYLNRPYKIATVK